MTEVYSTTNSKERLSTDQLSTVFSNTRTGGHDMELVRARLKITGSVSSHGGNRTVEIPTRGCYGCRKFSGFKGRMDEKLEEIIRLGNQEIGTRENTTREKKNEKN